MSTDAYGRTALHHVFADRPAASHAEDVRRHVAAGLDPGVPDRGGWAPLHFAAQERSLDGARALLDAGADVDARDENGNTPLWRAVFSSEGEGDLIRLLLAAGADPEADNDHGVSPRALAGRIANYDLARHFDGTP